jgi:hypothetical protein
MRCVDRTSLLRHVGMAGSVLGLGLVLAAGTACRPLLIETDGGPRPDAPRIEEPDAAALDAAIDLDAGPGTDAEPTDGATADVGSSDAGRDAPVDGGDPDCPAVCNGGCADDVCHIQNASSPVCPPGMPCDVRCTATASCTSPVDCSQAEGSCTVTCSGISSCLGSVTCGGVAQCDVTCTGQSSCTSVTCDGVPDCNVTCNAPGACQSLVCLRSDCDYECGLQSCNSIGCGMGANCNAACEGIQSCTGGLSCTDGGLGCRTCTGTSSCIGPSTCLGVCL